MRSFKIEVRGHPYQGLWRQDGPEGIEVRSDYGTTWAKLGGREPGEVAREVLAGMIPAPVAAPAEDRRAHYHRRNPVGQDRRN